MQMGCESLGLFGQDVDKKNYRSSSTIMQLSLTFSFVLIITLIIKLIIPEQRRPQMNRGGRPEGISVHPSDRSQFIFFSFTVTSTGKITVRQRLG
jgi:hypothetical protein